MQTLCRLRSTRTAQRGNSDRPSCVVNTLGHSAIAAGFDTTAHSWEQNLSPSVNARRGTNAEQPGRSHRTLLSLTSRPLRLRSAARAAALVRVSVVRSVASTATTLMATGSGASRAEAGAAALRLLRALLPA